MKRLAVLFYSAGLIASPAAAAPDITSLMISHPAADQWNLYGSGEKHELIRDATVNGGAAMQVTSAGPGANPWDIQAGVPSAKPVRKGDVLLMAFWGRAVTPGNATVPAVLQQTAAPYTKVGTENLVLNADWKLFYISGTADQDYPAGAVAASVQLATGAQTVALGPVFLLDFGPGYDLKYLPHNLP
ncbi:MAG: hypothetical protein QM647_01420 [Asticcacaulis sp.]|uniref:hypothetical protein n=1 Tax=Asticcacaulis sp. TaxID=1872648 RepID=UPI0039E6228A